MIPAKLATVIAEFEASDKDVPYWKAMPDADEPWGTGDCGWLSIRFARRCMEHGLDAFLLLYPAAADAPDPLQGQHACTGVVVDGVWTVDWTARQFHDLTDDPLECPRVWWGDEYLPLDGVMFDSPRRASVDDAQAAIWKGGLLA